jgi:hypothetical protein
MRLQNQRYPALPRRFDRPTTRIRNIVLMSLIVLAGCAGGTSGGSPFGNFFGIGSATPTPTQAAMPTATPTPVASPVAEQPGANQGKKAAKQARAASENAAIASKEAANASSAAALASKQAASVANRISGSGKTNADVSLESGSGSAAAGGTTTDPTLAAARTHSTPSVSSPAPEAGASIVSISRTTPTLSSAAESSGPPTEDNPSRAAKLIADLDKIEKRVDRKNLNADDSQRDILAQRLLQEAKKALADHDSVAALSLGTKASTLLEPLPKLADSTLPPTP